MKWCFPLKNSCSRFLRFPPFIILFCLLAFCGISIMVRSSCDSFSLSDLCINLTAFPLLSFRPSSTLPCWENGLGQLAAQLLHHTMLHIRGGKVLVLVKYNMSPLHLFCLHSQLWYSGLAVPFYPMYSENFFFFVILRLFVALAGCF